MRGIVSFYIAALFCAFPLLAQDQNEPLQLQINEGVIEPLPIAIPEFISENREAEVNSQRITELIITDLEGTGLFRVVTQESHIGRITNINSPVQYSDWRAINVEILLTGSILANSDGTITVRFYLHDVFGQSPIGQGVSYQGQAESWRRVAHKIADQIYNRITGESGYFDTQVAFVSEFGSKISREKRISIMDYDGANVRYLTSGNALVIAPRFAPDGRGLIYTSYETGVPAVIRHDIFSGARTRVINTTDMTFSPRFSSDGQKVILSRDLQGNIDIFQIELATGVQTRLTTSRAIDTSPSYSPEGNRIVFESDRSGSPQIYTMNLNQRNPTRVSFGQGTYGTPVWSPMGDYIAFTKRLGNKFHIGVMRSDGTEERLLSESFLDEGPTWAPNGRVIMFFRESPGEDGGPLLYSVDLTGRNLKRVPTPGFASDPSWSPLRN